MVQPEVSVPSRPKPEQSEGKVPFECGNRDQVRVWHLDNFKRVIFTKFGKDTGFRWTHKGK